MMSIEETTGKDPRFPTIDYVLVYSATNMDMETPRSLFEDAMKRDGLTMTKETIGNRIFLKITCPFERLAHEAERIKLEMPIKGCDIKPQEAACCRWLQNILSTDDEVDFVTAPFEAEKIPLFEGAEDEETFFRPALRSYLVHNIMINLDIKDYLKGHNPDEDEDIVSRRGLLYLLMKKAYTDCFVLHDPSAEEPYYMRIKETSLQEYYLQIPKTKHDPRREMQHTWVKFWKFQPLWKIRNYFGEQIAFYFAWVGTFLTLLWIPALLGVCIFAYGLNLSIEKNQVVQCVGSNLTFMVNGTIHPFPVCNSIAHLKQLGEDVMNILKSSFDNTLTPFFSLVICLWGSFFLEMWKRKNYTLAYQWDVDGFEHAEPDRPEFFGTKQRPDPITGELAWIYPISKRFRKFFVSALVLTLMICIVFISVSGVIAYKVIMRVKYNCTADGDDPSESAGRNTTGSPLTCVGLTTVVPTILNAVSILILGQIYQRVAEKLTFWENHRTQSEFNDSLIIKLFAFQFANTYTSLFYIAFFRPLDHGFQRNGVFGWGTKYRDTCSGGTCMSLLSFQVLVLMIIKPFPKFFKDVVIPWLRRKYRRIRKIARKGKEVEDVPENRPDTAKSGASREEAALTTNNFLEREFLKPQLGDFTLGEYTEKVIQFGYIVMFASSFALAPLLALIINLFDLRVDAKRLLWWNRRPVAFLASDIGMWYSILRFVNFCGVVSNAFLVGYTSSFCYDFFKPQGIECTADKRLAIVIVFEHLVFISMYLVNVIIPDVPASVKLSQRRERYQVIKIMEEGAAKVRKSRKKQHKENKRNQAKKEHTIDEDKDTTPDIPHTSSDYGAAKYPNFNDSLKRGATKGSGDSEKELLILADELERGNTDDSMNRGKDEMADDLGPSHLNKKTEERGKEKGRQLTSSSTHSTEIPLVHVPLD